LLSKTEKALDPISVDKVRQLNISKHGIATITGLAWSMVLNATFNNISVISWRLVLLGEEA
jgi:hypothetical protein